MQVRGGANATPFFPTPQTARIHPHFGDEREDFVAFRLWWTQEGLSPSIHLELDPAKRLRQNLYSLVIRLRVRDTLLLLCREVEFVLHGFAPSVWLLSCLMLCTIMVFVSH